MERRELIDRLTDHFLKVNPLGIGWVHPSWRDLVIDELSENESSRRSFLAGCGIEGVTLALSRQGGALGERSLPLLTTDADWDQLLDRLHRLLPQFEPREIARLLLTLRQSAEGLGDMHTRLEIESLASTVLDRTRELWDRQPASLPAFLLDAWYRLADDWLAFAEVLGNHDRVALDDLDFYGRDQELLQSLILRLTQVSAGNAAIRPMAEGILDRIRTLCPGLANEAMSALTISELASVTDARNWWTPEDLSAPPSREPVAPRAAFDRVDVERVLEDL